MKAIYDLSVIMSRAHAIRRAAALEMSCRPSEVLWSECLRMAWAEARAAAAGANASRVADEWAALDPAKQLQWLEASTRRAALNEIGTTSEDHYLQWAHVPAWSYGTEVLEIADAAWCRMADKFGAAGLEKITAENERRAWAGLAPLTLNALVYRSCDAAFMAMARQNGKASGLVRDAEDDEGNAMAYVETRAAAADDTESTACNRLDAAEMIDRLMSKADDIDIEIMHGLELKQSAREIAARLGIYHNAVNKRIAKMRKALRAMGYAG